VSARRVPPQGPDDRREAGGAGRTPPRGPGPRREAGGAAELRPAGLRHLASGKVRDLYEIGPDRLLLVTSDRISAFDVVLGQPIPGRGQVLTALTQFWLERLADLVPGHLVGWRGDELPDGARHLAGRALLVRRLDMIPLECVARGYLAGSGWKEYQASGSVCGVRLPPGLRLADRLPEPIFTPATKAVTGHDENVSAAQAAELVGSALLARLGQLTLAVYRRGAAVAAAHGIVLADTKLEFGLDGGVLVLGDEVLTPDSSRFWPADRWRPGAAPPSFDKQYVRDWLERQPWDKTAPAPALPAAVIDGTAARYREAYRRLTGHPVGDWLALARGAG
jgi:phosphoribosylaminoimidazole-succinocarboxamide synthase